MALPVRKGSLDVPGDGSEGLAVKLRKGTKVKFSRASGNPPSGITIVGSERHNGQLFYRVAEYPGALFLLRSFDALETKNYGSALK
jgi:hypothetical protein